MRRVLILAIAVLAGVSGNPLAAAIDPIPTADDIVRRNTDARGGHDAWCKIETIAWAGRIESARAPASGMPFTLQQKRPNKMRFELMAMNQKTIRAFDGASGWKVLPTASGRPEIQDYRPDETRSVQEGMFFDAPLIDCDGKGIRVVVEGKEDVQGHAAYRLSVTAASGSTRRIWVDSATFLESKVERESHGAPAVGGVSMLFRDYQVFEGLQLPTVMEIGAGSAQEADRVVIEKVALNPALDDRTFAKPRAPKRKGVVVDTRTSPSADVGAVAPSAATPAFGPARPAVPSSSAPDR